MRIAQIRERSFPVSRYGDQALPSGGLTTSAVAIVTDVIRNGEPIVGYGFSSIGRFAQSGLIRERFAPRLLSAGDTELADATETNLDPFRAWRTMMSGEKPGGHGERCVAVGTLDMAVSPYARRVLIVVAEKGLAHDREKHNFAREFSSLSSINPCLLLPVLVDGGTCLWGSI
jgi:D(-)-tartrate dehydratase